MPYACCAKALLEPCCSHRFEARRETVLEEMRRDEEILRLTRHEDGVDLLQVLRNVERALETSPPLPPNEQIARLSLALAAEQDAVRLNELRLLDARGAGGGQTGRKSSCEGLGRNLACVRRRVWDLMENPNTSFAARVSRRTPTPPTCALVNR